MHSDYSEDSGARIKHYDNSQQKIQKETIKTVIGKKQNYYSNIKIPNYRDKKYVCLFRGIKFNSDFFSNDDRRQLNYVLKKQNDINGRTEYSSSCFGNSQFSKKLIGKYLSGNTTDENNKTLQNSANLTDAFIDFLYKNTHLSTKVNSKYIYNNLFFALLNTNTNSFSKMDDILSQLTSFLETNKKKLKLNDKKIKIIKNAFKDFTNSKDFSRTFFISTSLREETAIKYAMPIIDKNQIIGFNPDYDAYGKPKHRNAGMVEIILYSATKYKKQCDKITYKKINRKTIPEFIDLYFVREQKLLNLDTRIQEQFEATFLNRINGKYIVASFPIYFPNFKKQYDKKYFEETYGINKKTYDEIKNLFSQNKNIDAMNIIINKLVKTYSKKLNNLTNDIINNNGKPKSSKYLPKIDDNMLIKMEKSQKSCTINNRHVNKHKQNKTVNKQNKNLNNNLNKAIILLNLSKKIWGFAEK